MKFLMTTLSLLCLFACLLPWTSGQYCNGPRRGYINDTSTGTPNGNDDFLTVGFLFPFHGPGQDGSACSADIPAPETIQFLEMARYALLFESIPGVRIALEAFDSCYSDQVAIEQSVRYLNDRLSVTAGSTSCPDDSFKPGIIFHGAGSVGPSVGAFLTDAQVPVVSYAATQSQLTNNDEFLYFSRTIPSDRDEAMAISDTLLSLGWTYVSVIHSEASDDASAVESFKTAAIRSNICISQTISFVADASEGDIGNTILNLLINNADGPSAVIIFASAYQASLILSWANNQINSRAGQIQWILGQHALSDTSYIDDLPITATRGILGVIPDDLVKIPTHSFETFFKMLRPNTNNPKTTENPWFKQYWQEAYQCNLDGSTKYPIPCGSAQETEHENTKLNPHTQLISNAVRNFLVGLNAAQLAKCGQNAGLCTAFRNMPPAELLEYIKGAGYKSNGDPATIKFAIQNYKIGTNSYYAMTTVGSWEEGPAGLSLEPADLELWSNNVMEPVTSHCGKDCYDKSCVLSANVTRVYRSGDIILGGMFSVHQPNEDQCGSINEIGVQRLEAMLFALDKLNQDNTILPGITVGVDAFDTCGVPDIAGHLALQFSATADFGKSGSGERRGPNGLPEHIYTIIGPESDEECELVSQITNVYELPVMGYAADSGILSNLYSYPNFARVIPPSQSQASAMVELIYRQGWQYMHVLYSKTTFGLYGANTIQSIGMSRDVCTTNKLEVPDDNSMTEWDKVFNKLDQRADARVLVLFLEASDIRNLFSQLTMRNKVGQYFIVASDRWPFMQQDLVNDFTDLVRGITVVTTPLREFTEFKSYFTNLRPNSNVRNPWFDEYWENKFQCSLDGDGTPCSGTNTVQPNELTDKYLADVIDSVYAVGHALDTLQKSLCPGQTRVCIEMTRAPGMDLWRLIIQQRFNSINQDGNFISFNSLGDGAPVFDIYNYQSPVNGGNFDFVKIGHFANYAYFGGIDNNRLKVYDELGMEIAAPQSVCSGQCHDCQRADEGNTAEIKDGDVWLGGFFRLHNIGPDKLTCTDEVVLYNMPLLEAFLFAIDSINDDPNVLTNIKLGAIGFDTCGSPTRAQREAANFITAAVEYRGGYFTNRLTVSGIIGEETSDTTLALAETVTPLKVSQISYAATTTKLDDRETYPYFMRTVASDRLQASAILDILVKFNWNYVSLVYSDDEFGNDMYNNIKKQTEEKGICIALALKVLGSFVDNDFNTIVKELQFNPQAKVVLLLTSEQHTKSLLREAEQLGVVDLQWVGGDTWGMRDDVIASSPLTASGSIILQFRYDPVPGFREYFTSRPTYTNLRNPWWKQYISDLFQCNLPSIDIPAKYPTQCPYNLDFDSVYKDIPEVQHIVRAVNIFAVGLQFAMQELCPNVTSYVCQQVLENPDALNRNIRSAGFQHTDGSAFTFDSLGNGPANYDILNIQQNQDGVTYVKVGSWDSGSLNLNTQNVRLYNGQSQIGAFSTQCQGRCSECQVESTKNVDFIPVLGQIQIPGLFAVHESGDHKVECGKVRALGVLNVEAFLFAINQINNDGSLLPNVRVGTTAFDTCMSGSRGVRELSGLLSGTATYSKEEKLPGTFSTIVGVVGAESDTVTRDAAALTSQYKYAQVSYGPGSESTSSDPYLLQGGPSHTAQANAVLSVIKNYGWQYISVVQGADSTFSQGASEFLQLARDENICVATNQVVTSSADIGSIVSDLTQLADTGARVVVVFASSSDIRSLLSEISSNARGTSASHLTWILAFPESIALSDLITSTAINEVLRGALAITPTEALPSNFEQYLKTLSPDTNTVNPWFKEIGTFSQTTISEHGQKAAYVIDATYAIARGIHKLLYRLCPNGIVCSDFLAAEPDDFYNEIAGITFAGINSNPISFADGTLVQRYDVSNFQQTGGSYTMVKVGSWKSGDESPILANTVRLFDGVNDVDNIVSSCSATGACTTCVLPPTGPTPTRPQPPPPPTTQAPPSKNPSGPNSGKLTGTPSSDIDSLWFIILVILCGIGIIVTLIIISLLVWRWDEPITRTISPFLCLVILIGIILLYAVTPIYAIPVSKAMCALQRVFPGVAWSVCLSGVFLQVMRHWRIGRRERRISGAKVSFVNNSSQSVLFLFLFAFQAILALEWLIIEPPSLKVVEVFQETSASPSPDGSSSMATPTGAAILECTYTKQSMITYCIFIYALLALSLFVSIFARRFSHVISVMELNTLLICTFVNVVIVAIWVAIELLIKEDYHRPATSAATALTATTTLIILFAYRVKVLFRNHDPFVDTASVASGEYFSGTLNRMPSVMRHTEHVYDSPPSDANGLSLNMNGAASNGLASNGSTSTLEKHKLGSDTTGF